MQRLRALDLALLERKKKLEDMSRLGRGKIVVI
jgi:hypothetical protein